MWQVESVDCAPTTPSSPRYGVSTSPGPITAKKTTDNARDHTIHNDMSLSIHYHQQQSSLRRHLRKSTPPAYQHQHPLSHMHFPPPPTYPPVNNVSSDMSSVIPEDFEHLAIAGPSNIDYSYAYYEPGPARKHSNVGARLDSNGEPHGHGHATYREGSYRSKHTYLTRYGTEENIYEEISDVARARLLQSASSPYEQQGQDHAASLLSIQQSLVEEEVRRVQTGHKRVLDQLNLSVEAMLMPSGSSSSGSNNGDGSNRNSGNGSEHELLHGEVDKVTELLRTIGPTDELLSPVHQHTHPVHDIDSGFSGSSSGASYRSVGGSLRRGGGGASGSTISGASAVQQRPASAAPVLSQCYNTSPCSTGHEGTVTTPIRARPSDYLISGCSDSGSGRRSAGNMVNSTSTPSKSFWSRKAWRKLGFSSSTSLNKLRKDDREGRTNDPPRWPTATDQQQICAEAAAVSFKTIDAQQRRQGNSKTPGHLVQSHSSSQRSSEDSWCSTASDPETGTSDEDDDLEDLEESDRSVTSSSQRSLHVSPRTSAANPFAHKARHLWQRGHTGKSGNTIVNNQSPTLLAKMRHSLDNSCIQPATSDLAATSSPVNSTQSRLSRWFSMRRGSAHQYDVDSAAAASAAAVSSSPAAATGIKVAGDGSKMMPLLSEVEEESVFGSTSVCGTVMQQFQQRRQVPPSLPPPPPDLTQQQQKRRMIIAAIVHSENSYVATLHRLVNDYKKLLEESSPPILSNSKISTLFYRLPEILQCHTLFRIALAESVHNWDRDERIGDVFVASFSKAVVLDIYSGFINNFSVAMDLAKMEAKRKSALADFLKVKQISSHDRLSFFGLMVKPVQRFPQFILFLQDLLKHTPQGHHDRMSLQLALTQLESLAEMLNERKREAEQFQAFKETLRHISGKFTARPLSDSNRYLLREEDVTQLEFNQYGLIQKAKSRRLLLLNDLVVCVAVAAKRNDDLNSNKRLTLKWMYPVSDVEIQDISASPTLSRLLTRPSNINNNCNRSFDASTQQPQADNLCTEMSNLMYDYEVMSRIVDLVGSLRGNYSPITPNLTRSFMHQIQQSIQHKDEEMLWVDSCCLQLLVRTKGGTKEEVFTFQTDNPNVKKDWVTELRLAQLALDPSNSPAWEVPEQESRPSTKMPLFVRAQALHRSQHQSEVRCGCYFTLTTSSLSRQSNKYQSRPNHAQSYLWICTTDGASSHIAILAQHPQHAGTLKHISSFSLVETQITCIEFIKGVINSKSEANTSSLASDVIVCGTSTRNLLFYSADSMDSDELIVSCQVPDSVVQIKYLCDHIFVALTNGSVVIIRRNNDDNIWALLDFHTLQLGNASESVSYLLPINTNLYAACAKKVYVINSLTSEITKSFSIQHEHGGNVNLMAHSGIGLWISLKNSSTICLYHTETFKHLQDINVASNVMRVTNDSVINNNRSNQVNVTALLACKGLLWVGTNVGISLTIPLPRLEGVPIISGRVNISYHAHFGPISFLLALQPRSYYWKPLETTQTHNKSKTNDETDKLRHHLTNSPVLLRRKTKENDTKQFRLSKTLPRGLGSGNKDFSCSTTSSQGSGDTCDVYDLYGKLMYIKDFEQNENCLQDHQAYESLRRSDPELAAIPGKVSTLDRRLRMKVSRPRSLDLSNWSVDSRSSSVYTSTSGSEESLAMRLQTGPKTVSRNNSFIANSTIKEEETASSTSKSMGKSTSMNNNNNSDNRESGGARRTIITLMGGRGYINWRQPCCAAGEREKSNKQHSQTTTNQQHNDVPNNNDSHIVIWELKL